MNESHNRTASRCSRIDGGGNPGPRAPSRRADAGHRQALRAAGASRPQGRRQSGNLVRRTCDSACRGRRCWPTGSTRIPPAVSCWDAIARPPPRSACCSSTARSARPIGPWSRADLPRMKAPSTCRSAGSTSNAAGGRSRIRTVKKPSPTGRCAAAATASPGSTLEPVTGRTHQLRVHTSATGWPIVGDNIYGNGPRFGEPTPASAFPRDRDSDFEEQGAGARGGAGAGAYAGAAQGVRVERGVSASSPLAPCESRCSIRDSGCIRVFQRRWIASSRCSSQ